MCGIAGFIGTRAVLDDAIQASLATLRRRGPDDAGFARYTTANGRHIAFLHTRLRIIDLDPRSNQPFTSGDVSVVFNGEIYNYLELKGRAVESLARRGAGLRTKSDTEILTELLNLDGLSTLDRIEGMFAFAAYDARTGEVHLARDRFGEKPLYVHRAPEGIYFASEIAALSALAGKRFVPNKRQLLRYLINGYKSLYQLFLITTPSNFRVARLELVALSIQATAKDFRDSAPTSKQKAQSRCLKDKASD